MSLKYQIVQVSALTKSQIERMFSLMQTYYVEQVFARFQADLHAKGIVILLITPDDGAIQGFSTVQINPRNCDTTDYLIYYSGDTIIHPDHWGSQELVKGFFHLVYSIQQTHPQHKLYWFLLSKGHRTYMYLPLFFKQYYPGIPERQDSSLFPILETVATKVFGAHWHPTEGLIRIPNDGGMVEELTEASFKKQNEHVLFFLERNPMFAQGEELACLVDLSPENFLPLAARVYGQMKGLEVVQFG